MKQQQIQQLKAPLYDCIFDHSQLHSMYTCGPRDEITGIIEPTAEQLAPVELLMDNIECQLIILGHSPAELPIWREQETAPRAVLDRYAPAIFIRGLIASYLI